MAASELDAKARAARVRLMIFIGALNMHDLFSKKVI